MSCTLPSHGTATDYSSKQKVFQYDSRTPTSFSVKQLGDLVEQWGLWQRGGGVLQTGMNPALQESLSTAGSTMKAFKHAVRLENGKGGQSLNSSNARPRF